MTLGGRMQLSLIQISGLTNHKAVTLWDLISNQSGYSIEWGMPKNSGIIGLEFAPKKQLKLTSVETSFSPSVSQTLKVWIQK